MSVSIDLLCARLRSLPDSLSASPEDDNVPPLGALLADVLLHLSGQLPTYEEVKRYMWINVSKRSRTAVTKNYFRLLYATAWLLHDSSLRMVNRDTDLVHKNFFQLLEKRLKPLAKLVNASNFFTNTDRREELVRLCLHEMQIPVEGESNDFAVDRLQALDSVARHKLIQAAQKRRREQERKRKLEEERRRKRAQEQAARYNRE